jgi:hypothetical protein
MKWERLLLEISVLLGAPLLAGVFVLWFATQDSPRAAPTVANRVPPARPPAAMVTFPPPIKPHLPDVDLFIKDESGNVLNDSTGRQAQDTNDNPDCRLEWTFVKDGEYRVVVDNPMQQHPGRPFCAALAKLTIHERGEAAPLMTFDATVPFNQSETRRLPFRAGTTYVLTIETEVAKEAAPAGTTPRKAATDLPP